MPSKYRKLINTIKIEKLYCPIVKLLTISVISKITREFSPVLSYHWPNFAVFSYQLASFKLFIKSDPSKHSITHYLSVHLSNDTYLLQQEPRFWIFHLYQQSSPVGRQHCLFSVVAGTGWLQFSFREVGRHKCLGHN